MNSFSAKRSAHLKLGRKGESLAADVLRRRGYTILARNWRCSAGELDIVAARDEELLFAEVKTLHKKAGYSPWGNLSPSQRRRNAAAAKVYLAVMENPPVKVRFDLFSIEYSPEGKLVKLECIADYLPPFTSSRKNGEHPDRSAADSAAALPLWKRLWRSLNLLPCPVCLKGDGRGRGDICSECRSRLEIFSFETERCPGCGGVLDGALALCSQCMSHKNVPLWQGIVSLFPHRGMGRRLVLMFKYGDRLEYGRFFGGMGADAVRRSGFHPDIVTSVPMPLRRRIQRTYNQAEIFGRMTAAKLAVPYVSLLTRKKHSSRQAVLSRSQRLKNLKGVFACVSPEKAAGKTILLVDDVFTTGATMTAAVSALMKARPRAVYLLTISRTPGHFKENRRMK